MTMGHRIVPENITLALCSLASRGLELSILLPQTPEHNTTKILRELQRRFRRSWDSEHCFLCLTPASQCTSMFADKHLQPFNHQATGNTTSWIRCNRLRLSEGGTQVHEHTNALGSPSLSYLPW